MFIFHPVLPHGHVCYFPVFIWVSECVCVEENVLRISSAIACSTTHFQWQIGKSHFCIHIYMYNNSTQPSGNCMLLVLSHLLSQSVYTGFHKLDVNFPPCRVWLLCPAVVWASSSLCHEHHRQHAEGGGYNSCMYTGGEIVGILHLHLILVYGYSN